MEIRPVRNLKEHKEALAEVERLWEAEPGTSAHDRLDVLVTLIEAYERKHEPVPPPDPLEAIRFRMEQLDLDRKALEPLIGSRARVSEVLSGRRRLSLEMIRRLHRQLGIPAEVLIGTAVARQPVRPLRQSRRSSTIPMMNDARHRNAEAHAKVMNDLRQRSPREIFQTAVDAGIFTAAGKLTAPYRSTGGEATKKRPGKRK